MGKRKQHKMPLFNLVIWLIFYSTSVIPSGYVMLNYDATWRKNTQLNKKNYPMTDIYRILYIIYIINRLFDRPSLDRIITKTQNFPHICTSDKK